jgi:DeoR family transcriptional regulator of aga operon
MSMPKPERLLAEERRRKILEILDRDKRVRVEDLVERFAVSAVTARSDLDTLAEAGMVVRSHGGAVKRVDSVQDYPIQFKETLHHAEKVRIGEAAAALIRPGDTVILDSGTTTMEVARCLKASAVRPVTVITNALNIAFELSNTPQVTVIMLGGILRPMSYSLVGPHAEQAMRELNADHLFMGVDGLDPESGPSTPDILEAQLNGIMIRVARQVTAVADAAKFQRRSLSVIARIEALHRIVTDRSADPETVASLRARGVEVVVV